MSQLGHILSAGITRKQYLILFLLGVVLTPVTFAASILLALYVQEKTGNQNLAVAIGFLDFIIIAIYFYVLKLKRLHDIGHSTDAILGANLVPGGNLFLQGLLFGKKTEQKNPADSKPEVTYYQTTWEKFLIFLIFVMINYAFLYATRDYYGTSGMTLPQLILTGSNLGIILLSVLNNILIYIYTPYLYSYFYRLWYNKWKNRRLQP
jgi:uncharacterized membrane protein YhaH (DUF805 family)